MANNIAVEFYRTVRESRFSRLQVIFKVLVNKLEIRLAPVHPSALVVKEAVCPLLKLLGDGFRLFVPLKPRLILFMETPTLALQRFRCQELLPGALAVVEYIK